MDKTSGWILTDDDSFQIRRKLEGTIGELDLLGVYELYQIQLSNPDGLGQASDANYDYSVAHEIVFASEIDMDVVLDCYGYRDLESFQSAYGDDWPGVAAECEFELTAQSLENLIVNDLRFTYVQAKDIIMELSGFHPKTE